MHGTLRAGWCGGGHAPPAVRVGFAPHVGRQHGRNDAQTGAKVLKSMREMVVYKGNCLLISK